MDLSEDMKKNINKYSGEEIIRIFRKVEEVAKCFLESGTNSFVISWIKEVQDWAEKNSDRDLLKALFNFHIWKGKCDLRELVSTVEDKYQHYLNSRITKNNVFIAHNDKDPFAKEVEIFLSRNNFKPIIMQEQPSTGGTIFDKFKSIEFNIAVVLLIEDPRLTNQTNISLTKQNVILEAGYCYGYLENSWEVIIMHDGKVEIPSNIGAVEYIKIDENWRYNLTRSLKAGGLKAS